MSDWPVALRGVTETVTTTLGPDGSWNVAALGVRAADGESPSDPAIARTWGRTRTRENFEREGAAYVQFVDDPVCFVEAALAVEERDDPVLAEAAAWAQVTVERRGTGETDGTAWADWALVPVEADVERTAVPTINRGFGAVVEASVWASRLDVPGYDRSELETRIEFLGDVVRRCGGDRERAAFDRLRALADLE